LYFLYTLDTLAATIVAQVSFDVDGSDFDVQNNGYPFSEVLHFSFQTCFFWESFCSVPQSRHPEEFEAEDFVGVSPLKFKLFSAIE